MKKLPAVFLDRDGTLIPDFHYPKEPEKVTALLPGVAAGLRLLQQKGYTLFVVSNQSGVGRGIISPEQFQAVHQRVAQLLEADQISIAEYFYCLHRPEEDCGCRKPKGDHLPKVFRGTPIDFAASFTVGDKDCDLFLGETLGAQGLLVLTGKGRATWDELKASGQPRFRSFETIEEIAHFVPNLS